MKNTNLNQYLPVNPITIHEARVLNRQGKLEGQTIYIWTYFYTPQKVTLGQDGKRYLEAESRAVWRLDGIIRPGNPGEWPGDPHEWLPKLLRQRDKKIDTSDNGPEQSTVYLSFEKIDNTGRKANA